MNAPGGIEQQDFPTVARGQVNLVDKFLAASDIVALRWRRRAQRKFPQVVQKGFSRDITDPEFKKNLQMLRQLTLGAIGVWQRAQAQAWGSTSDLPHHPAKAGTDTREYRDPHPRSFELTELAERIPIPLGSPITLRTLLGHRFQLDRFLIGIGDLPYVSGRAPELYNEEKGTSPTWSDLYWNCPPPLLDEVVATADQGWTADAQVDAGSEASKFASRSSSKAEGERLEITRRMLGRLLAEKEALDLPTRARREMKGSALLLVLPVLVISTAFFAIALGAAGSVWWNLLLAAAAGATGASLGGLLRLRNELRLGAQIREFKPFFFGQPFVGAGRWATGVHCQ